MRAHSLRVFWIAGKKDLSNWDYVARLVRRWDDIEAMIAARGAGPWFVSVNTHNLSEMAL